MINQLQGNQIMTRSDLKAFIFGTSCVLVFFLGAHVGDIFSYLFVSG